jgi:4-hydroxy-4-methyl-2-oxoglutarate aldolase
VTPGTDSCDRARDLTLVARLEALYPAVVADCLDRLGHRDQVLGPHIRPLFPSARVAGIAFTVHCVTIDGVPENTEDHYKGELQAVDALQDGDVMVVSTCNGSYWGELLATAARYRGARGIVADAYARDTIALIDMEFPTFVAGISAYDSLGRIDVAAMNVPISCGGVSVAAGDFVLADYDGVVIVPRAAAEDAIRAAEEKVAGENMVREKLAGGMPVWEAFRTYGII